mmetsp:Transcript_9037/g.16287  ORF Transcript_9037/g.16287 Transcript_9037/m.16287 type:complete len:129 (+) Transcript_9037:210-596(+)
MSSYGGSLRCIQACANCGRSASVEGERFEVEGGGLFCGKNCFWSCALDSSNSRLKRKPRSDKCDKSKRTVSATTSNNSKNNATIQSEATSRTNNSQAAFKLYSVGTSLVYETHAMFDLHQIYPASLKI